MSESPGTAAAQAFARAFAWARAREFAGNDPYDALRSPFLASVHRAFGRPFGIAVTQALRRSPLDLRRPLGVTPAVNPKGLALFLSAACRMQRRADVRDLADRLHTARATGWDITCWGYPFPWQARAFFLPAGTPTVVATSFAAEALIDAYVLQEDDRDLAAALDACRFVTKVLRRTSDATGACLSYSPLDHTAVYNASILGARLLIRAGLVAQRDEWIASAEPLVRYVLARQADDGSWVYGEARFHRWIDSFHTGFVLSALDLWRRATGDRLAADAVQRGAAFYAQRFFGPHGEPYYFADKAYPYDVHSAAQAVLSLLQLGESQPALRALGEATGRFLMDRFLSDDGHFIYQIRRTHRVTIPYMRWSQAWGVRALAELAGGPVTEHDDLAWAHRSQPDGREE